MSHWRGNRARFPCSPVSSENNDFSKDGSSSSPALSVLLDGTKAVTLMRSDKQDLEAEQKQRTSYM